MGNLGCVRFPLSIRKASGIKRGDRLIFRAGKDASIVLSKMPAVMPEETLLVDECAPEEARRLQCAKELSRCRLELCSVRSARVEDLGLLPGAPIVLLAEPSQIILSVDRSFSRKKIDAISPVRCPP